MAAFDRVFGAVHALRSRACREDVVTEPQQMLERFVVDTAPLASRLCLLYKTVTPEKRRTCWTAACVRRRTLIVQTVELPSRDYFVLMEVSDAGAAVRVHRAATHYYSIAMYHNVLPGAPGFSDIDQALRVVYPERECVFVYDAVFDVEHLKANVWPLLHRFLGLSRRPR